MSEDYFSIPAYSSSEIKAYAEDPISYLRSYILGKPNEISVAAKELGTLLHLAILEPEKFDEKAVYRPEGLKLTSKDGRLWKSENDGKTQVTEKNAKIIGGLLESLSQYHSDDFPFNLGDNILSVLRDKTTKEMEVHKEDFELAPGIVRAIKVKPDAYFLYDETLVIFDLKSTNAYNFDNPDYTIRKAKYYIQAAWYSEIMKKLLGCKEVLFYNIFLETADPYRVRAVSYNPDFLKSVYQWIPGYVESIEMMKSEAAAGIQMHDMKLPISEFNHQFVR